MLPEKIQKSEGVRPIHFPHGFTSLLPLQRFKPHLSMRFINASNLWLFLAVLFLLTGMGTPAISNATEREDLIQGLLSKKRSEVIKTLQLIGASKDPSYLEVLEAFKDKRLLSADGKVYLMSQNSDQIYDAVTGELVAAKPRLTKPNINNAVRRALAPVLAQLQLSSPNAEIRLNAANELIKRPSKSALELLESALQSETDLSVKEEIQTALAVNYLKSDSPAERLKAIKTLGDSGGEKSKSYLLPLLNKDEEGKYYEENQIVIAAKQAIQSIDSRLFWVEMIANFIRGLSLGSILLLAALGLAITFGLMRVINMAHGEMLMLGAYSTYVVQNWFIRNIPDAFSWYILVAIPFAFVITGLIGMIIERTVIRFLYGRPLETLLATWGISLLLIQTVRLLFGAQNVEVSNPDWLSGGLQIAQGFVLPYSRIAVLGFTLVVILMIWFLFQKTSLGLKVRAVTQNREMASCLGVSSSKTDMWTFGLGSGIAGLGGVALSQLGNVGPELGQSYIVDSFLVVVLGGVGKISGTVISALGLGVINKYMEPAVGAVLGKIIILVIIILVIQKRPQGLFAPQGRIVEER